MGNQESKQVAVWRAIGQGGGPWTGQEEQI